MTRHDGATSRGRVPAGLDGLAERFGLADVYVFGSRAPAFRPSPRLDGLLESSGSPSTEADADPEADLDIGVRPLRGRHLGARDRADLVGALEDLFDAPRVDLIIVSEAPPYLALAAISGELLYCYDAADQSEYELYVLRRAGDLAPFERERRARILGEA